MMPECLAGGMCEHVLYGSSGYCVSPGVVTPHLHTTTYHYYSHPRGCLRRGRNGYAVFSPPPARYCSARSPTGVLISATPSCSRLADALPVLRPPDTSRFLYDSHASPVGCCISPRDRSHAVGLGASVRLAR